MHIMPSLSPRINTDQARTMIGKYSAILTRKIFAPSQRCVSSILKEKVITLFGILAFFLQHLETFLQVAYAAIFCIKKQQLFARLSRRTVNPVNMNPKNITEENSKYSRLNMYRSENQLLFP